MISDEKIFQQVIKAFGDKKYIAKLPQNVVPITTMQFGLDKTNPTIKTMLELYISKRGR